MRRAAPCHAAVNSRNVAGMMIVSLSILAMALAFAGVIIGFRQPPASTFGAAILPAVWLPSPLRWLRQVFLFAHALCGPGRN